MVFRGCPQYRMNTEIMDWSSEEFYDSALEAHESVADHLLWCALFFPHCLCGSRTILKAPTSLVHLCSELPGVSETLETSVACMFVDTSGEGIADSGSEKESKYNEGVFCVRVGPSPC